MQLPAIKWRRVDGSFGSPKLDPLVHRRDAESASLSPVRNAQCCAAMIYPNRAPLVPTLDLPCRPAAVLWRVVSVAINAVKRKARRAFSHVGEERRKLTPSSANGYASTAIIFPTGVVPIVATFAHAVPSVPRPRDDSAGGVTVLERHFSDSFSSEASTTCAGFSTEPCRGSELFRSAITYSIPPRFVSVVMRPFANQQSSESLSSNVFDAGGKLLTFCGSHLSLLQGSLVRAVAGLVPRWRLALLVGYRTATI